jgi:hypothetical protein
MGIGMGAWPEQEAIVMLSCEYRVAGACRREEGGPFNGVPGTARCL